MRTEPRGRAAGHMVAAAVALSLPILAGASTPLNHGGLDWLAKRRALLSTIWDDGLLPTHRNAPNRTWANANYSGVTWFQWDITSPKWSNHPMNSTVWYHPIRASSRSRRAIIMHQGHGASMPGTNLSAWVHNTLGCDYLFLWMPLMGPNQQHGYPPHHWFFKDWEAQGDKTIRYFVEPTALAINYALALGYEDIIVSGISGGAWTTTVYAALDPRVTISLPLAGSLPWYLFKDHQIGDYEQRPQPGVKDWYLTVANFTELYVLAALEPGRVSVQTLHENDPCCFHGAGRHAVILGYDARVSAVLSDLHGGTFSTSISDWNVHEWDEHSRAIVAAALVEATQDPSAPKLDRLPCDILQHPPDAVPCPWPPAGPPPPA